MKKTFYISILILAFSGIANAQISGQLFMYDYEIPWVQVYFKNSTLKIESDFDGYFELPIPSESKKIDLIFNLGEMIVEIQNMESNISKLDLGKIILPEFKSIEIEEYEQLTESEKENCRPIYCWTDLLGYLDTNRLETDYLTLNCKEKITKFEYNPTTKTIAVDWNLIKQCE